MQFGIDDSLLTLASDRDIDSNKPADVTALLTSTCTFEATNFAAGITIALDPLRPGTDDLGSQGYTNLIHRKEIIAHFGRGQRSVLQLVTVRYAEDYNSSQDTERWYQEEQHIQ